MGALENELTATNIATLAVRTAVVNNKVPVVIGLSDQLRLYSIRVQVVSIAGLVLTTEALAVEKKEKEKAMPGGDPHGGMGGMDF